MELMEKTKYKKTDVGLIPEDWQILQLGSLGRFSKGQGIRKDQAQSGDLPCIRYGELYTRHNNYIKNFYSFISKEIAATSKKLNKGDILFAGSGETKAEIGKCVAFLSDEEAYAGGDIVILSPKSCSSLYLGYLLNSPNVQIQKASRGQGDAVVHISAAQLSNISIALPSLNEQTAIANALSDTDAMISSLEKLIAKRKLIKQGVMQQLLKPKKGWEVKKLGEVAEFMNGKGHEQFISESGQYTVINSKFVSTDGTVFKNSSVNLCPLSKNDITIVMSDIPNGRALAKCFIVPADNLYALNQRIGGIRAVSVHYKYLAYILNRNDYYLSFDSGSGQTNLKKNDVLDCPLYFPPTIEEQNEIAKVIEDMENEIRLIENKHKKYQEVKQGMMQVLLTGKVRLI